MDVIFAFVAGLGLRTYLTRFASSTFVVVPAVVGLWEGVFIHRLVTSYQLSSPSTDHYLAFGLRLIVDYLIARNARRVLLVMLWAAIGTILSDSVFPILYATQRDNVHTQKHRDKKRRHTKSYPSRLHAYQTPMTFSPVISQNIRPIDTNVTILKENNLKTPHFPPPSPPSFFLQATSEPSPFPESPITPFPNTNEVPGRPQSALAFYPENSADNDGDRPHFPPSLPTPPDSTFRERTMDSRVDRLSTIEEITSGQEESTAPPENEDIEQEDIEGEPYVLVSHSGPPLPIPNPTSHYVRLSENGMEALALSTPTASHPPAGFSSRPSSDGSDPLRTPGQPVYEAGPDSDIDELATPIVPPSRVAIPENQVGAETTNELTNSPPLLETLLTIGANSNSNEPSSTQATLHNILQQPAEASSSQVVEQPPYSPTISEVESVLSVGIPDKKLIEYAATLRAQADQEKAELFRLRTELNRADAEKRVKDALFLRGDIEAAEQRLKKLHTQAEKRFYAAYNRKSASNTIDVHGLKPAEALQRTEKAFRELLRNGQTTLKVIVGKGNHSVGKIPVLKNYLIGEMKRRHIPCNVDVKNSGVLILSLPLETTG